MGGGTNNLSVSKIIKFKLAFGVASDPTVLKVLTLMRNEKRSKNKKLDDFQNSSRKTNQPYIQLDRP